MSLTTFDTLKFVRRLEQAGVSSQQAEVQAEVLTEAFNVNLDSLVTKDYLAAQFADQKAYVDKRFAEVNAYVDTGFTEQKAYMNVRFAKIENHLRFFGWTQAIVIAVVMVPILERLASL